MLCPVDVERWLRHRLWPALAEVGMACAGLVVGFLVSGAVYAVVGPGPWVLGLGPLRIAIAALFYWKVGLAWARAAEPEDVDPYGGSARPGPVASLGSALLTVLVAIVAALVGSVLLGVLFEALGWGVQEQSTVLEIVEGAEHTLTAEALALAVSALVMAPLTEEWLFRGLLFRRIGIRSGRPLAYAFSALAFAALHGNPAGFVIYLWLGLVFAVTYERTGWLGAAMAVHMGNNAYVLAVLFGLFGAGAG